MSSSMVIKASSSANLPNSKPRLLGFTPEVQVDPEFFSRTSLIQMGYGAWVNLSTLAIGLAFGFSATSLPQMNALKSPELTPADQVWMTSVLTISAPVSCLVSGYFVDHYGRRLMLSVGQLPTIVGWMCIGLASNSRLVIIGRLLTGIGIGMLMTPPRIFVTEITLPNMRGPLGALHNVALVTGMMLQAAMGSRLTWKPVCFICAFFSLLMMAVNLFLPETPYFTLIKNDEEKVLKSLKCFRGHDYGNLDNELEELLDFKMNNVRDLKCLAWLGMIVSPCALKPFFLMVPYMIAVHLCGSRTLFFNTVEILQDSKSAVAPHRGEAYLTTTRLLGGVLTVMMLYKNGRRPMALISCLGCGFVFIYLGFFLRWWAPKPSLQPQMLYIVYVMFACFGYYALTLLILLELLPLQVRGFLGGVAESLMFALLLATNALLPYVRQAITFPHTLMLMGAISLATAVYLFFCLPETRRLTLQEIEEHYKNIRPTLVSQRDLVASLPKANFGSTTNIPSLTRTKSLERHKKVTDPKKNRQLAREASKRRSNDLSIVSPSGTKVDTEKKTTGTEEKKEKNVTIKEDSKEDTNKRS